ncbi:hypothetical protein [Tenacibaculum agarivorans]|uniref:hypothetical protein n=1 Tax=Tenacibaculum agarivorans TaxID=1908389 RepID=UPI00094B83CE|nr:hypothetical protein [Tenacibaculum agarivorans]
MKYLILLITCLGLLNNNSIDAGDPSIQAVCKITTKNNTTHEGFITLIKGGYCMLPNGFYFEIGDGKTYRKLYDFNFYSLQKTKDGIFNLGYSSFKAKRAYFITHTPHHGHFKKEQNDIAIDSKGKKLVSRKYNEFTYKLFDSIPLFKELPREYHLRYDKLENLTEKIAMSDIISVEIVKKPQQIWLDRIAKAKKLYWDDNDTEDSTGDFLEPTWYHELIQDQNKFNTLKDYYNKWKKL